MYSHTLPTTTQAVANSPQSTDIVKRNALISLEVTPAATKTLRSKVIRAENEETTAQIINHCLGRRYLIGLLQFSLLRLRITPIAITWIYVTRGNRQQSGHNASVIDLLADFCPAIYMATEIKGLMR